MSASQFQRSHNQALSHVSVDSKDSQLHGSCEVSIILPCYNCAPFVERSFDTLCEHLDTLSSSWEIIMVDDGSEDFEILNKIIFNYEKIQLVKHDLNKGMCAARNTGIKKFYRI